VASLLLVPSVARAGDPAAAESLFDDGKQLMAQDRYAEACPKFEESQKLDPGLGTQFHLADCWQHLGRMASAWALFRSVESQARVLGQAGRVRVAHDRATALEQALSKIVVVPQAEAPGLEIRRDGIEIGRELWDWPVAVDAGPHVVTATAPNKQAWSTTVDVPPHGNVVTVEVPLLADTEGTAHKIEPTQGTAATAPMAASLASGQSGVTEPMPPDVAEKNVVKDRGGVQRGVGWFLVGAGVAGLGAGAYFGTKWLEDRSSANTHCVNNVCDATGLSLRDDAHTEQRYATVFLAAGGGAILLGAVLAATAPSAHVVVGEQKVRAPSSPSGYAKANLKIAPILSPYGGGLGVSSAW
jgi:hypothetical protein